MEKQKVFVSVFQKAKKGEAYCGDSYFYQETEEEFICALADGLGSGPFAMESSEAVIDAIKTNPNSNVEMLIKKCNQALTGKRGVVLGILKMNFVQEIVTFSSIGNIGLLQISKDKVKSRNIPSSGYLGGYKRSFKVISRDLEKGTSFIMFSDGVSDKEISRYFIKSDNVNEITSHYEMMADEDREDDTTLIAMRYHH